MSKCCTSIGHLHLLLTPKSLWHLCLFISLLSPICFVFPGVKVSIAATVNHMSHPTSLWDFVLSQSVVRVCYTLGCCSHELSPISCSVSILDPRSQSRTTKSSTGLAKKYLSFFASAKEFMVAKAIARNDDSKSNKSNKTGTTICLGSQFGVQYIDI